MNDKHGLASREVIFSIVRETRVGQKPASMRDILKGRLLCEVLRQAGTKVNESKKAVVVSFDLHQYPKRRDASGLRATNNYE